MVLERQQIIAWFRLSAETLADNKDLLTELDAAIGDADHGHNVTRGYEFVRREITAVADQDIGTIFKTMALVLMSKMGGAGGQLYASSLIGAANMTEAKVELTSAEVADMLDGCVDGIVQRGHAEVGHKTMVDVWRPAATAFRWSVVDGKSLSEALDACVAAAENGMLATIDMCAQKGRASYLGERSIGHQDPGATSSFLIIKALRDVIHPN